MVNAFFYSNIASPTTLSGSINNSVTSCTVAATTGWPGSVPYIVALDYGTASEELVKVTANAAGTLTIQRAYGGTTAVSHSTGAVVRHVYNAQDATDFRTHEQSTSGAHGIAGSFVGTTDTQTLTNKTLTSPAITGPAISGGGSLAGTFSGSPTFSGGVVFSGTPSISNGAVLAGTLSGSPTFSGTPTFSGNPSFTGTIQSNQAVSTNTTFASIVTLDSFDRFRIDGSGIMNWGSGAAARDVNLYRQSANVLATDDTFRVYRNLTSDDSFSLRVGADTQSRLLIKADGTISWGTGALAGDTNLYRSAADTLATDDSLTVGGTLTDGSTSMVFKPYINGTASVTMSAVSFTTQTVSFGTTFASAPRVLLVQRGSQSGTSALKVSVDSATTTNFVLRTTDVNGNNQTVTTNVDWFAVTP